jgi:hypothetical protein
MGQIGIYRAIKKNGNKNRIGASVSAKNKSRNLLARRRRGRRAFEREKWINL